MSRIELLLIDPQNDFCDIPESERPLVNGQRLAPALPVSGADADMKRVATMIERLGSKLYDIHVTLDSHNPVDIAHPAWWMNSQGQSPAPFTLISSSDVEKGVWRSRNPKLQERSLAYVRALEANARYVLVIWPEHCLIGSWGHNVHASVKQALDTWARNKLETINFVTKGSNPYTEHYSAVQAEVPDPRDPGTAMNRDLLQTLAEADTVLIAGEALSHCVANTVRDIANNFGDDNIRKLVLLTDASSSVGGFENLGVDFVNEMVKRGMQLSTTGEFLQ